MSERKLIQVSYEIVGREELPADQRALLNLATKARESAHAPYSNFHVGAAIGTNNDGMFPGHNSENIVYAALHAEEAAIGALDRDSRESGISAIATMGGLRGTKSPDPVLPCGLCRQKLLELLRPGDNPVVIAAGMVGDVIRINLRDLVPLAFFPALIQKK